MTDLVNIGSFSNDGTGDPARVAFAKINAFAASANAGGVIPPIYPVVSLPTPVAQGTIAYVNNALAPSYLSPVVGGGTTFVRVMFNGAAWVCA
jgi:hypothetical protein